MMRGTILAVCVSEEKGVTKQDVGAGVLIAGCGLERDAHAGPWHRQVSLLGLESIEKMKALGADVGFGDFAENLTVDGLQLYTLPLGTRLLLGSGAILEVTQIGKKCHSGCAIMQKVGDCVMPREGIFTRVITGGPVKNGDIIEVIS